MKQLPLETRLAIWNFTFEPQVVLITYDYEKKLDFNNRHIPVGLHVESVTNLARSSSKAIRILIFQFLQRSPHDIKLASAPIRTAIAAVDISILLQTFLRFLIIIGSL